MRKSECGVWRLGALLGSISSQKYFNRLCATVSSARIQLDWYNGSVDAFGDSKYRSFNDVPHDAQPTGVRCCGLLTEQQLAETLKGYSYLVAPTGRLDDVDDNPRLWRIFFAVGAVNLPVITLGDPATSAARFLQRFEVGVNCPYEGDSLGRAAAAVVAETAHARLRNNAAVIAPRLSAKGMSDGLWASIDLGQPVDLRFEELLERAPGRAMQ